MGDPFFVIDRMRAIGEHLQVVLIFKSLNETLLRREFHVKFHVINPYRTNCEGMSVISIFFFQ